MCYTKNSPKGVMSDDIFVKIVNECAAYNVKTIVPFFRGEPFCDQKYLKKLQYIRSKMPGVRLEIASNGTLINSKAAATICSMGINFFSISLDTGDRNLNYEDRLSAENAVNNLSKYKTEEMFLQVSTVDVGQGDYVICEFIDEWKDKVDRVRIFEQHDTGKTNIKKISRSYCRKLDTDIVVYYNGNIGLCCYDWNRPFLEIGNVKVDSILDIWNSDFYNDIRQQHKFNCISDRVCKDCDMWRP